MRYKPKPYGTNSYQIAIYPENEQMAPKILLIEDHTLVRETWMQFLNLNGNYNVVGAYGTANEGLAAALQLKPDVVLMDINLPDSTGYDATKELCSKMPSIKVIGVSFYSQPAVVKKMIRSGAVGYLTKSSTMAEFFTALEEVLEGRKFICMEVRNLLAQQLADEATTPEVVLSARELEIVRRLGQGASSKEIAAELHRSVKTIERHRYNIIKKLKVKNTAALIHYFNNSLQFL